MSGKFLTLEGIEGVGKSSNMQFIAQLLKQSGHDVLLTREPGGTPIAERVRHILLSEFEERTFPKTELLLLYAGRLQHVETVIKPALQAGKWVLCDRFTDATFAYQGAGRGIPLADIELIHQWTLGDFAPEVTFILDAPVELAFSRIHKQRDLDRFEKEQKPFFERIRHHYLSLSQKDPKRYQLIDASQPLPQVQNTLREKLAGIL